MPSILFFDTETTGLPDWHAPSEAAQQPHIVQLAAMLVDAESRELIQEWCEIATPDGWTIPAEIAEIHGITTERALAEGLPERTIVNRWISVRRPAGLVVAHNLSFDRRIMRIAMRRELGMEREAIEEIEGAPSFCTMQAAKPILQLPPTGPMMASGRRTPKSPKLAECIQYWFGEDLPDAHDALADVRACARVYWAIKDGLPPFQDAA